MFYLDVWRDAIALRWDGALPPGVSEDELAKYYKPEFYQIELDLDGNDRKVPVPAPGVSIREKLKNVGDLTHVLPQIHGHASWNERQRCFFLALSAQNLRRVHAQFGHIRVATGQQRIDWLKREYVRFQESVRKAQVIKTRPQLPAYQYKAPPLGDFQHRGGVYLTNVEPGAMLADCGMGKTWMVLCSTEQQIMKGLLLPGQTLVCVKLMTIKHGWIKDAARFTNLKVQPVWTGSSYKRKEKLLAMLAEPADVYVINHDGLRVLKEALADRQFKKVVVDESTILKSYRGPRATKGGAFGRALMEVADSADYRVIMSGTPAPNSAEDLWGQFAFIDPHGFLLEKTWKDFKAEFTKEIFFGDPNNPETLSKHVVTIEGRKKIAALIEPLTFRLRLRDHIKDMPARFTASRSLPMVKEQLKHYEEMEEFLETLIDDEAVTVTVQLAMIQKLRQITGGFLIDRAEEAHVIEDNPKLEMLDGLLNDEIAEDEKVVIFAQYRWEIETIAERYKALGVVTVYGGNQSAVNEANIGRFVDDPAIRVIVLHPRSAAHGVTLTVARYMVMYSLSYSSEEDYQSVKRIERASQAREMYLIYLLAEDSIDEVMYDVVQTKAASQSALIDPGQRDTDVAAVWKSLAATLRAKRQNRRRKRKKAHEGVGQSQSVPG